MRDGEKDMPIDALVPIADFFNHEWPPGIKWAYTSRGNQRGFFMAALRDIAKGE